MACRCTGYSEYQLGMIQALSIINEDTKEKLKGLNGLLLEHKEYCKKNNWKKDNNFIRYVKIKHEIRILNQNIRTYKRIFEEVDKELGILHKEVM